MIISKIHYHRIFALFLILLIQTCSKNPFPPEVHDILVNQNRRTLNRIVDQYLKSPSVETRYRLCLAIANSRDTLLVPKLTALLADNSPLVRGGAAFAFGQLASSAAESILVKHLPVENDDEVCRQIAMALGQIGSQASLDFLLNPALAVSNDISIQALVYYFQRQVYNPNSLRYAIAGLQSADPSVARWSIFALSRVRDRALMREITGDLQTALKTKDIAARIKVVACLAPLNFPEKAEIWPQLLADNDPRLRIEAARGIAYIAGNAYVLHRILNDSVPQVVASALENLPDSLKIVATIQTDLRALTGHPSPEVRGALVKFLTMRGGLSALHDFDLLSLGDNLLPAAVEGLIAWGRPAALAVLDSLSNNQRFAVSTPAYLGLIAVAGQNKLSPPEFGKILAAGLRSDDPVKIAVAAEAMRDSSGNYREWQALLFPPLKNLKNTDFTDAIIEILKTIAVLRPPGGMPSVEPLLVARDLRIRNLARQILTEVYQTNIPKIADDYYGAGRQSRLTKLAKYDLRPTVLLETDRGTISIRLDGYYAPFTVDAFLTSIEKGFYNGLSFHRV
ncbi:MAG: HEAT repeat domain-containing protein, partial [Candidatus Neomarinimicrobiota bacterium]